MIQLCKNCKYFKFDYEIKGHWLDPFFYPSCKKEDRVIVFDYDPKIPCPDYKCKWWKFWIRKDK